MPDSTVARSAFAHDAVVSDVAESLFEQPDSARDAATATATRTPRFFFTLAPKR